MDQFIISNVETPVTYLRAGQFIGDEGWKHADRIVDSPEIIVMTEGELYLSVGGEEIKANANTFLLIPQGVRYFGTKPSPQGTSFFWCHFLFNSLEENYDRAGLKRCLEERYGNEPIITMPYYSKKMNFTRLNILFNQLIDIIMNKRNNPFYLNYFLTSILMEISEETLDNEFYKNQEEKDSQMLLYIREWIRVNLENKLSLENIAEEFNYNKSYLSRYFSERTGYTITEYIRKLRVDKAKTLLLSMPTPIEEIARSVGFSDVKYFMRSFKKSEGMTPTEFRNAYRQTKLTKH